MIEHACPITPFSHPHSSCFSMINKGECAVHPGPRGIPKNKIRCINHTGPALIVPRPVKESHQDATPFNTFLAHTLHSSCMPNNSFHYICVFHAYNASILDRNGMAAFGGVAPGGPQSQDEPRVQVVEESIPSLGGPKFKDVKPKTYQVLESELPASEQGGQLPCPLGTLMYIHQTNIQSNTSLMKVL